MLLSAQFDTDILHLLFTLRLIYDLTNTCSSPHPLLLPVGVIYMSFLLNNSYRSFSCICKTARLLCFWLSNHLSKFYKMYCLEISEGQVFRLLTDSGFVFRLSRDIQHDLKQPTSGKHVRHMYTPETPLLSRKTGVCRGMPNFLIFDPIKYCGYS